MIGRVREVGIQDKLDRLDEAFLFERSIDIDTYDRHAEKLREELTLARSHSGQLVTERSNAATEERLKSGHAVGPVSIV